MNEYLVLHSDLNCFYASVEMNEEPSLRGKAIAVCGSTEDRHGIVLTKSYPAKRMGVKTGMAIWQAKQACPDLICVSPHYGRYLKYSRLVRRIYRRYSDHIEPFGMDENWIRLPYGTGVYGTGLEAAEEIRAAVQREIGLTVSIGVSFSKIFAKLGSDMKKPDAVTPIDREDVASKVWPLPAGELLYVGPATQKKLAAMNVRTIGDLARCDEDLMHRRFGKNGVMLKRFAEGSDDSPVMPGEYEIPIKSVGHGTTCVTDLEDPYSVWRVLYQLTQDISHRLIRNRMDACGVQLSIKDKDFGFCQYQTPLCRPTQDPLELAQAGFCLFRENYPWIKPVRALTMSAIRLVSENTPMQTDLFFDYEKRARIHALNTAIDRIRIRFGEQAVFAASLMGDLKMAQDKCETVIMPGVMYRG